MAIGFPHLVTTNNGRSSVTAFNEKATSPVYTAESSHPSFSLIIEGLEKGDPWVWSLFDIGAGAAAKFNQVSDRVSWNGREILFDGDPVHSVLAEQLTRALESGSEDDITALAQFWEKLESNPDAHSREQSYTWLATHKFQITPDGDVIGYKGVTENEDGTFLSWHASEVRDKPSAYVNGVPLEPQVRVLQKIGDVVSMPRSEVVHDPNQTCSRGLHVATFSYARGYGRVLLVSFNPRDICSIPKDADGMKARVSKYKVIGLVDGPLDKNSPVLTENAVSWNPKDDVAFRG